MGVNESLRIDIGSEEVEFDGVALVDRDGVAVAFEWELVERRDVPR